MDNDDDDDDNDDDGDDGWRWQWRWWWWWWADVLTCYMSLSNVMGWNYTCIYLD